MTLMAQLIAALDYTNADDALATAATLRGCPVWMKVGLELFTHEGPSVVARLKDMGFKVMLDLKMFDIPNTVKGGVRSACLMGADLITVFRLEDGLPALLQHASSLGRDPWDLMLPPDGRFLLASDRRSDALISFNLEPDGSVGPERSRLTIPQCVGLTLETMQ